MKKTVAITILIILITSCCLTGCIEEVTPRYADVEVINPITGEVVNSGDTIDLPEEKTRVEVRIKDKETGIYLTDDDLPEMTVESSYRVSFRYLDSAERVHFMHINDYWPLKSQTRPYHHGYKITISFDCRPKYPRDPKRFKRKYQMETFYIIFYYNLNTEK